MPGPAAAPPQDRTLTASALKSKLDAREALVILDVRSPEEFEEWHISGSVNLPLPSILTGERPSAGQDARFITVCLHGARSAQARDVLETDGYSALSLDGGMVAWNSVFDVVGVMTPNAQVRQMRRVGKGCISYIVVSGEEALVIDATIDIEAYLMEAKKLGARIVAALDTHAHADHVSGGRRLAEAVGGRYHAPAEVGVPVATGGVLDGDEIPVGATRVKVLTTPGHTPGSVTYLLGDLAFTGDTLFVESVGRPDLGQDPKPNAAVLWKTLHERILTLSPKTRVLPGHYGAAVPLVAMQPIVGRIDRLKETLPALSMSEREFVEWVAKNSMPKPANFDVIKRHNNGAAKLDLEDLRELEAGPNRCAIG